MTLTGTGNYTGTTEAKFRIGVAELSAELGWKSLKATGTYFAQLKVTCTNGLGAGVADLKFLFADRVGACLGFDVLARFLDDDIEIRGRDVRGSVERSPWMLTVYVGYEF